MSKVLKILQTIVAGERSLRCQACGNSFTCGASLKGCWCSEIKLSGEARAELRSLYSDCLCRDCLEKQSGSTRRQAQLKTGGADRA
jgi:Cysteine-rich CWC